MSILFSVAQVLLTAAYATTSPGHLHGHFIDCDGLWIVPASDSTTIPVAPTIKSPRLAYNVYGVWQPGTSPNSYLDAWLLKLVSQRGQLGHGITLETTMSILFSVAQVLLTAAYATTSPGHLHGHFIDCDGLWIVPASDSTTNPVAPTIKSPRLAYNVYGVWQPGTSPNSYLDAWLLKLVSQRGQLGHGITLETTMSILFSVAQVLLTGAYATTSPGHLHGHFFDCDGLWIVPASDSTTNPVAPTIKSPRLAYNVYGVWQPGTSPNSYLDAWLLKLVSQRGQLGHGITLETTMSILFSVAQVLLTAAYATTSPGHLHGHFIDCDGLWIVPASDSTTIPVAPTIKSPRLAYNVYGVWQPGTSPNSYLDAWLLKLVSQRGQLGHGITLETTMSILFSVAQVLLKAAYATTSPGHLHGHFIDCDGLWIVPASDSTTNPVAPTIKSPRLAYNVYGVWQPGTSPNSYLDAWLLKLVSQRGQLGHGITLETTMSILFSVAQVGYVPILTATEITTPVSCPYDVTDTSSTATGFGSSQRVTRQLSGGTNDQVTTLGLQRWLRYSSHYEITSPGRLHGHFFDCDGLWIVPASDSTTIPVAPTIKSPRLAYNVYGVWQPGTSPNSYLDAWLLKLVSQRGQLGHGIALETTMSILFSVAQVLLTAAYATTSPGHLHGHFIDCDGLWIVPASDSTTIPVVPTIKSPRLAYNVYGVWQPGTSPNSYLDAWLLKLVSQRGQLGHGIALETTMSILFSVAQVLLTAAYATTSPGHLHGHFIDCDGLWIVPASDSTTIPVAPTIKSPRLAYNVYGVWQPGTSPNSYLDAWLLKLVSQRGQLGHGITLETTMSILFSVAQVLLTAAYATTSPGHLHGHFIDCDGLWIVPASDSTTIPVAPTIKSPRLAYNVYGVWQPGTSPNSYLDAWLLKLVSQRGQLGHGIALETTMSILFSVAQVLLTAAYATTSPGHLHGHFIDCDGLWIVPASDSTTIPVAPTIKSPRLAYNVYGVWQPGTSPNSYLDAWLLKLVSQRGQLGHGIALETTMSILFSVAQVLLTAAYATTSPGHLHGHFIDCDGLWIVPASDSTTIPVVPTIKSPRLAYNVYGVWQSGTSPNSYLDAWLLKLVSQRGQLGHGIALETTMSILFSVAQVLLTAAYATTSPGHLHGHFIDCDEIWIVPASDSTTIPVVPTIKSPRLAYNVYGVWQPGTSPNSYLDAWLLKLLVSQRGQLGHGITLETTMSILFSVAQVLLTAAYATTSPGHLHGHFFDCDGLWIVPASDSTTIPVAPTIKSPRLAYNVYGVWQPGTSPNSYLDAWLLKLVSQRGQLGHGITLETTMSILFSVAQVLLTAAYATTSPGHLHGHFFDCDGLWIVPASDSTTIPVAPTIKSPRLAYNVYGVWQPGTSPNSYLDAWLLKLVSQRGQLGHGITLETTMSILFSVAQLHTQQRRPVIFTDTSIDCDGLWIVPASDSTTIPVVPTIKSPRLAYNVYGVWQPGTSPNSYLDAWLLKLVSQRGQLGHGIALETTMSILFSVAQVLLTAAYATTSPGHLHGHFIDCDGLWIVPASDSTTIPVAPTIKSPRLAYNVYGVWQPGTSPNSYLDAWLLKLVSQRGQLGHGIALETTMSILFSVAQVLLTAAYATTSPGHLHGHFIDCDGLWIVPASDSTTIPVAPTIKSPRLAYNLYGVWQPGTSPNSYLDAWLLKLVSQRGQLGHGIALETTMSILFSVAQVLLTAAYATTSPGHLHGHFIDCDGLWIVPASDSTTIPVVPTIKSPRLAYNVYGVWQPGTSPNSYLDA
ncbi:uncharacterized protein ISCGN_013224 [Ixodes scapularis]